MSGKPGGCAPRCLQTALGRLGEQRGQGLGEPRPLPGWAGSWGKGCPSELPRAEPPRLRLLCRAGHVPALWSIV